nr:protein trichome birefringence-like 8 [Ipomoea batatas]
MDLHPSPPSSSSHKHPKFLLFNFPLFSTNKQISHALFFFFFSLLLITSLIFYRLIAPIHPQTLLGISLFSPSLGQSYAPQACDYSYGEWVWDGGYPGEKYTDNCPFLDPGFRCHRSGRRDLEYQKWRWKPHGCHLPRFNASDLLRRSRNGRIVFAGDSILRNQWESMLCMLAQGVANQSSIHEQFGNPITKHKGYLSMRFEEFNLTVEYYRIPFLVPVRRPPANASKEVKGVLRLDQLHWFFRKLVGADVLVFSGGHWWNEDKTHKMGIYFQEGKAVNMSMNITEAFSRSLNTWALWVMRNLSSETHIIFRSYSPVHYRNGTWNSGGSCHTSTAPERDQAGLGPDPINNVYISKIVEEMAMMGRNVSFLNVTYLSEFRRDGHPSNHREPGTSVEAPQDCSHWCLPGVPDTWNELLYNDLLLKGFRGELRRM